MMIKSVWGNVTFISASYNWPIPVKHYCHTCQKRTLQLEGKPYWLDMKPVQDFECAKCGDKVTKRATI
jgi:ribosomal protein L44E